MDLDGHQAESAPVRRDATAVEAAMVDALPDIVAGLIARARYGDTKAALYLIDRVLGKTVGAKAAPADDRTPP
jgi:hypothetical protein